MMKRKRLFRYLLLLLSLSFVVSCTNVLDKPANSETFAQDSLALSHNKKYDPADFLFLRNYLQHWASDSLKGLKTYRDVLDSAYNRRILRAKMKAALSVKALQTIVERHCRNGISGIYFKQNVEITNIGKDTVSDLMGYFYIVDPTNDTLNALMFFNSYNIYPNQRDTSFYMAMIEYSPAKQKKYDTISVDKLRFLWSPQKIVFTNGEKLIVKDSLSPDKYFKPDTP